MNSPHSLRFFDVFSPRRCRFFVTSFCNLFLWGAAPRPARGRVPLTPLLAVHGMFFKTTVQPLEELADTACLNSLFYKGIAILCEKKSEGRFFYGFVRFGLAAF